LLQNANSPSTGTKSQCWFVSSQNHDWMYRPWYTALPVAAHRFVAAFMSTPEDGKSQVHFWWSAPAFLEKVFPHRNTLRGRRTPLSKSESRHHEYSFCGWISLRWMSKDHFWLLEFTHLASTGTRPLRNPEGVSALGNVQHHSDSFAGLR